MKHRKATNIKKSRPRQIDISNRAMSLKDENNGIYNFEEDVAQWLNHQDKQE